MAGDDIIPTTPASNAKIVPFNVPIKLSLDKHNYNSWSSFLKIHLGSLGLKSHIEGTGTSNTNPEWNNQDDLVKVWILGTLNESLQDQVVTTPGNAKGLWDHIKDLFHDNKDARAITLDSELRLVKIGSLSINNYCTKIQGMVDSLHNLGEQVSDKNMVMYAINGLDDRFKGIVRIIRHREPLPTFETARNMLLLEEATFNIKKKKKRLEELEGGRGIRRRDFWIGIMLGSDTMKEREFLIHHLSKYTTEYID